VSLSLLDRILSRCYVDPDSGCWHWKGDLKRGPRIKVNGRTVQVRRVVANVRSDRYAHMSCRCVDCVNPDHVDHLTKSQYEKRKVRGRDWHAAITVGNRNRRNGKINAGIASEIRASADSGVALAARHGVSEALVSAIRHGKVWAEVNPWAV